MTPIAELDRYRVPIGQRARFPGLRRMDAEILALHCQHNEFQPDQWFFDVPLGPVNPELMTLPYIRKRPAEVRLYANRADVIYTVHGVWYLAELKPAAAYIALGQALLYSHLLETEFPNTVPVHPVILTDWCYPPLRAVADAHGVAVAQLPNTCQPSYDTPHRTLHLTADPLAAALGTPSDQPPELTAMNAANHPARTATWPEEPFTP